MSLELIPLVIRKGEKITLANEEGVTIQVGNNNKGIIYQVDDTPANHEIKTLDFADGKYTIVITLDEELVSMQELTVLPVFAKQSKKQYLRETIAYESLGVLQQLKTDYERQLSKLIQAERRKQGISPIKNIKLRLTR